ncbi:hypothetical protein N7478_003544 [Penicillium angulare]|uniref:uncharacterized protein n=1 Tax=Penicillium angulare TaxID=116970 RepID=UPI002540FBBE|nr:uncharacterized protein N7478_003544 [Penicillium angulare]KAJ5287858.1 hypothetical protein N7478_003544 [Penicillium angulare]
MCLLGALGFLFNKDKDEDNSYGRNPANGPRPSNGPQNPAMGGQYPTAPRPGPPPAGPPPGQAPPYR